MEPALQHPEIVNPHGLGKDESGDRAFVTDLGLDTLLASVPFRCSESRELAKHVIVELSSDMDTVAYRQDVLAELLADARLRTSVQDYARSLSGLDYKQANFRVSATWEKGLDALRSYREAVGSCPDLTSAASAGLREVGAYISAVARSSSFAELGAFLERIDTMEGIDFRVYLDRSGRPVRMSALEVSERKPDRRERVPLLERWLGKKEEGQRLRDARGPNELGKTVQEYMDREFTSIMMAYLPHVREIIGLLNPLDFYASFAEYFARLQDVGFDICRPALLPTDTRSMSAAAARNPLLVDARALSDKSAGLPVLSRIKRHRKEVVPNDVAYDPDGDMFIITGPNNGGKTTYVKMVGLLQLMGQKGLLAAARTAEMSFVDGLYTHFVTPEDITKGEGRYKNELRRIRDVIEKATPCSLVILDEPCGGTSHEEGERQSLALLDGFHKLGCATYFTTHMHLLTREVDSGRYPAARNLSVECTYDGTDIRYTYKVRPGAFGKSFGEEIARELGLMPEDITETISRRAREKGFTEVLRD